MLLPPQQDILWLYFKIWSIWLSMNFFLFLASGNSAHACQEQNKHVDIRDSEIYVSSCLQIITYHLIVFSVSGIFYSCETRRMIVDVQAEFYSYGAKLKKNFISSKIKIFSISFYIDCLTSVFLVLRGGATSDMKCLVDSM